MDKFYLVPVAEYLQLKDGDNQNIPFHKVQPLSNVVSQIQNPEKNALVNSYNRTRELLNNQTLSKSLKADLYLEELNKFDRLKDKLSNNYSNYTPSNDKNSSSGTTEESIIEIMPKHLQPSVRELLHRMTRSGIFSWSPTGILSIHGKVLQNGNIVDLINDVMLRTKKPKGTVIVWNISILWRKLIYLRVF